MASTYLDWAATGPPIEEILQECGEIAREYSGNPSSRHTPGKKARDLLENARDGCARILNCNAGQLSLTSGGSESNNIVFSSLLHKKQMGSIVISAIEHASVYEPVRHLEEFGYDVRYVQPNADGRIDPSALAGKIDRSTQCVSVMHVNNETGAIQPIEEICKKVREAEEVWGRKIHLHCDAVQSFGKIEVDLGRMDVDSLAASGHKLGAMRGSGLLYLKREIPVLYRGGGQEHDVRPGTENLPAIWGLYRAASSWSESRVKLYEHARALYSILVTGISDINGAQIISGTGIDGFQTSSPYILTASLPPIPGEVLVRIMSDRGYYISTGSACSSKGKKNTRVLMNMGMDKRIADSAIRISTGPLTSASDCESFCRVLSEEYSALQQTISRSSTHAVSR